MMLDHAERLASARATIDYITGASADDLKRPVPNCPGWTVYNAASHIGRVAIAWEEMIVSSPDDPESRTRGYARSDRQPEGASVDELAAWAHSAIDKLDHGAALDRPCYFSMTGGEGSVALWGWHVATELGIHRLDVEAALGHDYSFTDAETMDAAAYTCRYFLPAMGRILGRDPGGLTARLAGPAGSEAVGINSETDAAVTLEGPPVQVLLALWDRPHQDVHVTDGDASVLQAWQSLPGEAFQFGTWD